MMPLASGMLVTNALCTASIVEKLIVDFIETSNHDQKQKPNYLS
jgi:hypothetical protein